MGLRIDFDGYWDDATRLLIGEAVRTCMGEPPGGENWSVSVDRTAAYCDLCVTTPRQTRRRMFFDELQMLPRAVCNWLKLYPFT